MSWSPKVRSQPTTLASPAAVLLLLLLLTAANAAPEKAPTNKPYWDSHSMPLAPPAAEDDVAAKNIGWNSSVPGSGARMRPTEDGAASTTCVGSLLALSPCLPFFRDADDGGTDESSAPEGCCEGLLGIVAGGQEVCLCHVVNHTLERAIGVDIPANRAFALIGGLCGVTLPEDFLVTCASRNNVPPLYACPAPSA